MMPGGKKTKAANGLAARAAVVQSAIRI